MFTWINKQGVKSNKGFVVQRVTRFTSEYLENNKVITIEVESSVLPSGKYCLIISSNAFIKWDDGTLVNDKKQNEILNNFKDAMEFQDMSVIVD